MAPYRAIEVSDRRVCGEPTCLVACYGDRYVIASFGIGDEVVIVHWLSKN